MNDSQALRQHLGKIFSNRPLNALASSDARLVARLTSVRQALTPVGGHRSLPRIAQGIMAFRLQRRHTPYPELKYACYGLARPTDWEGRLLLNDSQLCDDLLAALSALLPRQPQAFAACCRGLRQALASDIAELPTPDNANLGKIIAFLSRYPTTSKRSVA